MLYPPLKQHTNVHTSLLHLPSLRQACLADTPLTSDNTFCISSVLRCAGVHSLAYLAALASVSAGRKNCLQSRRPGPLAQTATVQQSASRPQVTQDAWRMFAQSPTAEASTGSQNTPIHTPQPPHTLTTPAPQYGRSDVSPLDQRLAC